MSELERLRLETIQAFLGGKPVPPESLTRCQKLSEQAIRSAYTKHWPVGMLMKHKGLTLVHGCPDLYDPPIEMVTVDEMIALRPEVLLVCSTEDLQGLSLYMGLMHEFFVNCLVPAKLLAHASLVSTLMEIGDRLHATGLLWTNSLENLTVDHG